MDLFLIRHGQSEGNVGGWVQGWHDAPLTDLGARQARRTATALSQLLQTADVAVSALYSSPLQRAYRTAEVISQALGQPVHSDPGLREMHFGRVEGLTDAEWKARYPELLPGWQNQANLDFGWPEGETRRGFAARIGAAIGAIVERHAPAENVVVVSHGGVISGYLAYVATGDWQEWRRFRVNNCSISRLALEPGHLEAPALSCLLSFNEMGHLQDADVEAVTGEA